MLVRGRPCFSVALGASVSNSKSTNVMPRLTAYTIGRGLSDNWSKPALNGLSPMRVNLPRPNL